MMKHVKKKLLLTFGVLVSACMLFAAAARADICVLKTGDYSGTSPCDTADSADGTADGIINLEFYAGSDIEVDVLYQQEETKYRMELYTQLLYYDTANMTDPTAENPNSPTDYITCNPDPSGYFKDQMSSQISKPECDYAEAYGYAVDTDGTRVIAQYEMNFTGDTFPAAGSEPDTFVMDQITFTNESYVQGDTYEYFDFATTGGSPTDVGVIFSDNTRCPLINLGLQCADNGITTPQALVKTKVTIEAPGGSIGTPSAGTPTCVGNPGCSLASGTATFQFSYTLPTTCYGDSICSTTSDKCSASPSVVISDGTNTYEESDGVYTETVNVGDVISGYTMWAVDSVMRPSYNLSCSGTETGTVSIASVTCKCGDPPVISLTDSGLYGYDGTGKWFNKRDIEVDFTLTDPDADQGSGLPDSVPDIKFYFTNDMGETTYYYDVNSNTKTALDSEGVFSAIIDGGEYVRKETPIYFGVIATDEMGLQGEYPPGFTCESDTSCDWSDSTRYVLIPADNIPPTNAFVFTEDPFPNMFPFRAGPDSLLKIFFEMSDEAKVTMRVYSMDGDLVRQVESRFQDVSITSMERSDCYGEECNFCDYATGCVWDGTNKNGGDNYVTNGMYIIDIRAESTGATYRGQTLDFTKAVVVMK